MWGQSEFQENKFFHRNFYIIEWSLLIEHLSWLSLTVAGDKIGEVEVEFPDGDVDVIGVDAEARLSTFRSLL